MITHEKPIDLFIVGGQKTASTSVFNWLKITGQFNSHCQTEMSYYMYEHEKIEGKEKAFKRYFPFSDEKLRLAKHVMAAYCPETLGFIKSDNPNVKVIYITREPIKRIYSAYWYARFNGWEKEEDIITAIERNEKNKNTDHNLNYISNSDYEVHIERLVNLFGKDNVLVLSDVDVSYGKKSVIEKVGNFVDLKLNVVEAVPDSFNESKLPKSYLLSKVLNYIFSESNPIKKYFNMLVSPNRRVLIRKSLLSLNRSKHSYPKISLEEKNKIIKKIPHILNYYNSMVKYDG
ncbi:sulfotransferase domain-containing protein [Vibrio splendidus]|uniref:sulfotransferase domain-containing protein n=1 Tax=Vibrio splendidus TaxID=29497 RepID=UPI000C843532|nr:sulfotransferase domain-containing protein [Vibrio splendidus]PMI73726.1 hypothetical protein BCU38_17085 [Vibrio splendidus]